MTEQDDTLPTEEPTLGELGRRLADIQSTVHDLVDELKRSYVRTESHADLTRRVESLESSRTWIATLIIGAVVLALLGLVLINRH